MSKNIRRRGRRRARAKKGNWFTRMKLWQRILLIVGIVVLLVFFIAVAYVYTKWSKIDTRDIKAEDIVINEEVKLNKELDLGDGYKNVALFGVDSRDGSLGKGNRTDCIIVASLNNETKEIKMVSVYRDTLLNLSEGTYQKCNGAYSYGGPVMAINMLNMNLDLDIEDYVTVDFGAIADAIDLLGGVDIEVTEEEVPYINSYIWETAASAGKEETLVQTSGLQTLNGVQATTYARIRSTAGGDFTRTERQRLVIEKMFEKAKTADLGTINEIIDKVFPQVSTSFTLQEILMYASAYSEYTLSENMGFPVDKYTDTVSGLGSIVIPQDLTSNVTKLHEFLFGTAGYTPSSTVQNVSSNIQYTVNSAGSSTDTYSATMMTNITMTVIMMTDQEEAAEEQMITILRLQEEPTPEIPEVVEKPTVAAVRDPVAEAIPAAAAPVKGTRAVKEAEPAEAMEAALTAEMLPVHKMSS